MQLQTDVLTAQSISCLKYANKLAINKNRKEISADDIFWWTYNFIKNSQFFSIFANIMDLNDQDALERYYQTEYEVDLDCFNFLEEKKLPLNKKSLSKIQKLINDGMKKLDFVLLFYISFSDLSSECIKHINSNGMSVEKTVDNCQKIAQNPIVNQIGSFAFFQLLDKILNVFNLDSKNVKMMKIENIKEMSDINMLLDAVESEIVERNDTSVDQASKQGKKEEKKLTIEYFWTDLTREVKDGFIDPIIWRENEINQIIYTLLRKNKSNPLLIWEAWVGKTAIVEWLAQKIAQWDVPDKLKNKRIFLLDMWTIVAGTKYRWEFEARMKSILEEAMDVTNNIILFIDEIHTIIWAGGQENNDAAQMIKPLLARAKIKLIGATTFNEYQKHIEKDAALKRRFQEVIINEPDNDMTRQILIWLKQTYEDFHGVQLTDEAIDASIKLSKRYMLNKFLPDKALDIIDEACARKSTMNQKLDNDESYKENEAKISKIQSQIEKAIEEQDYFGAAELKQKEEEIKQEMQKIRTSKNIPTHLRPIITKDDIGNVLADKAWVPANIVNESEIEKLRRLSNDLKVKIIWQDEAVDSIVKTLTKSRLSVVQKNKPIGSFLFLGPSGVGKTYLAKLIAKDYFGDETAMIRIDMSEFMEKYSVSKLIGSPAGYVWYEEWGNLTEAVRRKPYSVVLFDEIEKASGDVLNIMLQILDEGQLKDAKWRLIDFKSTIIIMTSNIGSEEFAKKQSRIWFTTWANKWEITDKEFDAVKDRVMEEMKTFLSPEFLNRIDYKIVFKHLGKKDLATIMKNKIDEFLATWKSNSKIKLPKFSEKQITEIVDKIYDPQFGARPLERYIQDEIEPSLIKKIMDEK